MSASGIPIEAALAAVGDLLEAAGDHVAIVIVGGATLNLLGLVQRTTGDVDVIARAYRDRGGAIHLLQAEPFPPALAEAVLTVARDFGLRPDWLNAGVGAQWVRGLPPWILADLTWRSYGQLDVGLVGRRTLVALKLFAATDAGTRSVHAQDLRALAPTDTELEDAAAWVATQDAYEDFRTLISEVIAHVRGAYP